MHELERTRQTSNDQGKKPPHALRRVSSQSDMSQWESSQEASLSHRLSKSREQRILRENWCRFLAKNKEVLASEEKEREKQLIYYENEYSKQEACKLLQQELNKLLDQAHEQLEHMTQSQLDKLLDQAHEQLADITQSQLDKLLDQAREQFERMSQRQLNKKLNQVREQFEHMTQRQAKQPKLNKLVVKQLLNQLLERAKGRMEKLAKHSKLDPLRVKAVEQIADNMKQLLEQGIVDQCVVAPLHQLDWHDLKESTATGVQRFLLKLQHSLPITAPLVDYQRIKNDRDAYRQGLEEHLQLLPNIIKQKIEGIVTQLEKNQELFRHLKTEEQAIYGLDAAYGLLNDLREGESEGYSFYDHTLVLTYAQEKQQERYNHLIEKIIAKYEIKENNSIEELNNLKIALNVIIDRLEKNILQKEFDIIKNNKIATQEGVPGDASPVGREARSVPAPSSVFSKAAQGDQREIPEQLQNKPLETYSFYREARMEAKKAEELYNAYFENTPGSWAKGRDEHALVYTKDATEVSKLSKASKRYEQASIELAKANERYQEASKGFEEYQCYQRAKAKQAEAEEYFTRTCEEVALVFGSWATGGNEHALVYEKDETEVNKLSNSYKRYEQASQEVGKAYECYKEVSKGLEAYQCYQRAKAKQAEAEAHFIRINEEIAQAFRSWEDASSQQTLAANKLEVVEKERSKLDLLILDSEKLKEQQALCESGMKDAEAKISEAAQLRRKTMSKEAQSDFLAAKRQFDTATWLKNDLQKYKDALVELQEAYRLYDEACEQVTKATTLSHKLKAASSEYQQLCKDLDELKEAEKAEKRNDANRKVARIREHQASLAPALDRALIALNEAKSQEESIEKLCQQAFQKKRAAQLELERSQSTQQILLLQEALKAKEMEKSLLQQDVRNAQNELSLMRKVLTGKYAQRRETHSEMQDLSKELKITKNNLKELQENKLIKRKDNIEEHNALSSLRNSIKKIKRDFNIFSIDNVMGERNNMAKYINEPVVSQQDYLQESEFNDYNGKDNDVLVALKKDAMQIQNDLKHCKTISDIAEKKGMLARILTQVNDSMQKYQKEIQENNLHHFNRNSNEVKDESLKLYYNIKQIKCDLEHCKDIRSVLQDSMRNIQQDLKDDQTIEEKERNHLVRVLGDADKLLEEYQHGLQSDKQTFIESYKIYYNIDKNCIHDTSIEIEGKRNAINSSIRTLVNLRSTQTRYAEQLMDINQLLIEQKRIENQIDHLNDRLRAAPDLATAISLASRLENEEKELQAIGNILASSPMLDQLLTNIQEIACKLEESTEAKLLEETVSMYDKLIIAKIHFQKVATTLCKFEQEDYKDQKSKYIKRIEDKIKQQIDKESCLQSTLEELANDILHEETQLLSKKAALEIIKTKEKDILLKIKQLEEKIDSQKKVNEQLHHAIDQNALLPQESNANKNIADLAIERITQYFGLVPVGTKAATRVSPTTVHIGGQETVTQSVSRETQDFAKRETGSFPTAEQLVADFSAIDVASEEDSSDDELSRSLDLLNHGAS